MKVWIINYMEVKRSEDGLQNVVVNISYTRKSIDILYGETFTAETSGTLSCPKPENENFIPYDQLTKADVDNWLDSILGTSQIDASLDLQIQELANPPLVRLPLPFSNF
jgi:hypothetical protein